MRQHDDTETMSRRLERFWRSSKLWVDWVQWARVELRAGRPEAWWLAVSGPRMRKRCVLANNLDRIATGPGRARLQGLARRLRNGSGYDGARAWNAVVVLTRRNQLPGWEAIPPGVSQVIVDVRDAHYRRMRARDARARTSKRRVVGIDPGLGGISVADAIVGAQGLARVGLTWTGTDIEAGLGFDQDLQRTVPVPPPNTIAVTHPDGTRVTLDLQGVPESEATAAVSRATERLGGLRQTSVLAEIRRGLRLRAPLVIPQREEEDGHDLGTFLAAVATHLVQDVLPDPFVVARQLHTTPRVLLRALDELVAGTSPDAAAVAAENGLPGLVEACDALEEALEPLCVADGCPNPWRAVLADRRFCELHGREWDELPPETVNALEPGRYPLGWGLPALDPVVARLMRTSGRLAEAGHGSEVWEAMTRAGFARTGATLRLIHGRWTGDDLAEILARSIPLTRELSRLARLEGETHGEA